MVKGLGAVYLSIKSLLEQKFRKILGKNFGGRNEIKILIEILQLDKIFQNFFAPVIYNLDNQLLVTYWPSQPCRSLI
jgi:hypothetical protein